MVPPQYQDSCGGPACGLLAQISKFADPVECRARLGELDTVQPVPGTSPWLPGAVPFLVRDGCAAFAALDRSDPLAYVGAAYKPMKAHTAKAGVAKPRVLTSSATPELGRHQGPQDPPSCLRSARRLCFS